MLELPQLHTIKPDLQNQATQNFNHPVEPGKNQRCINYLFIIFYAKQIK